jgi:hypothetical protein
MKSFVIGSAVAIVIAIAAALILSSFSMSTAEIYATSDVRL